MKLVASVAGVTTVFLLGAITENCMTWAVRQRILVGGRLLMRRSQFADHLLPDAHRHGLGYRLASWVPHFAWADADGRVWQYTVREEWKNKWRSKSLFGAWLALWLYDGVVEAGDPVFGNRVDVER